MAIGAANSIGYRNAPVLMDGKATDLTLWSPSKSQRPRIT
jgi:hypothetical protein